jgi:hypothetical protein
MCIARVVSRRIVLRSTQTVYVSVYENKLKQNSEYSVVEHEGRVHVTGYITPYTAPPPTPQHNPASYFQLETLEITLKLCPRNPLKSLPIIISNFRRLPAVTMENNPEKFRSM